MTEPIFGGATERVWKRLPSHFKESDPATDWTMKRYLSGLLARMDVIDKMIEDFRYVSPEDGGDGTETPALIDPNKADAAWFPWLSQLFGVPALAQNRAALSSESAYSPGTQAALIATIQSVLIGDKYVQLEPWTKGTQQGSMWDLTITTRTSETLKNIVPEYIATASNTGTLKGLITNATTGESHTAIGYGETFSLVEVSDDEWYGGRVAFISHVPEEVPSNPKEPTAPPTTPDSFVYLVSTPEFPASPAGDPFNYMYSLEAPEQVEITVKVEFMNASKSVVSTNTTKHVVGPAKESFWVNYTTPAGATLARFIVLASLPFKVGEFGARTQPEPGWVPRSADPIKAVIEAGAKPAGIVLHSKTYASTWDALEANLPDWNAWESAGSWDNVEEAGL